MLLKHPKALRRGFSDDGCVPRARKCVVSRNARCGSTRASARMKRSERLEMAAYLYNQEYTYLGMPETRQQRSVAHG